MEHVVHVPDVLDPPAADVLVERRGLVEHLAISYTFSTLQPSHILIERRGVVEHMVTSSLRPSGVPRPRRGRVAVRGRIRR